MNGTVTKFFVSEWERLKIRKKQLASPRLQGVISWASE
jgi:hypothetical protein